MNEWKSTSFWAQTYLVGRDLSMALFSGVDNMSHAVVGEIDKAAPLRLFTQTASTTSNPSRPSGATFVASIARWLEIRPSQVALIPLGQKFDHTFTISRYNRHGTLLFYVRSSE
jgi:hypothetical protein